MSNPLDRPIWSALTTRQKAISHGSDRARRFPADVAPFADVGDTADLAELAALVPAGDFVVMFTGEPVEAPPGLAIVDTSSGNQMVLESLRAPQGDFDISPLAAADVPAMQELVRLTNPGPFGPRTIELGRFVGIRRDGRLVAMAGERLKPEGHTEITGVCTHPDHRGRGYSQALVADVARHILGRGDTPFLHVYSTNKSAITLYEKLGFSSDAQCASLFCAARHERQGAYRSHKRTPDALLEGHPSRAWPPLGRRGARREVRPQHAEGNLAVGEIAIAAAVASGQRRADPRHLVDLRNQRRLRSDCR